MKTIVACLATAPIVAGGAYAHEQSVTPTQIALLKNQVAALQKFQRRCLLADRIRLTENANRVLVWNSPMVVPINGNSGVFYGTSDNAATSGFCLTGR